MRPSCRRHSSGAARGIAGSQAEIFIEEPGATAGGLCSAIFRIVMMFGVLVAGESFRMWQLIAISWTGIGLIVLDWVGRARRDDATKGFDVRLIRHAR